MTGITSCMCYFWQSYLDCIIIYYCIYSWLHTHFSYLLPLWVVWLQRNHKIWFKKSKNLTIWLPFCLCKLDGQKLKISLGNRVYRNQHTWIMLKSLVPNLYLKMPLTCTFSRNPTILEVLARLREGHDWHNKLYVSRSSVCTYECSKQCCKVFKFIPTLFKYQITEKEYLVRSILLKSSI